MGLRELKRERTRQLISDKAFELFIDHGFGRTTVEQIAAAAEVGPSTLYRYYPTKERLVLEFVEQCLFTALDEMRDGDPGVPLEKALGQLVSRALGDLEAQPARTRAIYELAEDHPSLSAHLADLVWRWRDELAAEIAKRLENRTPLVAALTAAVTIDLIEMVVQTWVDQPGPSPTLAEIATEALSLLANGELPLPCRIEP
ncbi:TetR/AcrR family transcriptional regulator [Kribbella sp. NBC_01245]|uniref:TetR/AcrR family transcriptional regulator n=1 Tax=Kribbella sp. NBC_01245 TaxID=2903578 RepID=UPI002E2BF8CD|nr:TetR/AcrR family transcriptional regulator [Kribbella sp. NBC_01245]